MACLKLVCAIVLCMVVVAPMASEAVISSCLQVELAITPCLNYLKNGGDVSKTCCASLTKLNNDASTTAFRRKTCECIKAAASKAVVAGANVENAASLPGKCNIKLPFTISSSIDCNSIN